MYVCSSIYAVCIIFIFQRLSSLTQQGSFWLRPLRITAGVALLALGLRPCGVGGSHQLIGPKLWAQRRQGPSWWYSFLGSEDGGRNSYDLWWTCVYFVIIKKKACPVLVSTRCLLFSSVFHLCFSQLFALQWSFWTRPAFMELIMGFKQRETIGCRRLLRSATGSVHVMPFQRPCQFSGV